MEKYDQRKNWEKFLETTPIDELKRNAEKGDVAALFNLGVCYQEGLGTRRNLSRAAKCFEQGAAQNDAESIYELGVCYADGLGVPRSQKRAVGYYERAAKLDNHDAQYDLGMAYSMGKGVKHNDALAAYWFGLAAAAGHNDAQYELAWCFKEGKGVAADEKKAFYWFGQAAESDNGFAKTELAEYYLTGTCTKRDEKRGFALLQSATKHMPHQEDPGVASHCYEMMAQCYETGTGVEPSLNLAELCLSLAVRCDPDNDPAVKKLVDLYFRHSTELDPGYEKAIACLRSKVEDGDPDFKCMLAMVLVQKALEENTEVPEEITSLLLRAALDGSEQAIAYLSHLHEMSTGDQKSRP